MDNQNIIVRQATINDKDKIWSFLELAYKKYSCYKFPDRWNWQYLNNPNWKDSDLPIWIAIKNGEIIGQSNALFSKIKFKGKIINAGWSTDTVILPEFRGSGIGTRLQDYKLNHIKNYMAINIAFYNRKIMSKIGAKRGNSVIVLKKYFSINKYMISESLMYRTRKNRILNKLILFYIKFFFVHAIIAFVLNKIIYLRNRFKKKLIKNIDKVDIVEVEKFDSEIDQLWERVKNDYSICSIRKHKELNWKFFSQPHVNYRFFVAKKGNKVLGYSILRKSVPPEKEKLIIADLFSSKYDGYIFNALIRHAVDLFKDKVRYIECATSINVIKQNLINNGFIISNTEVPMFYSGEINDWEKLLGKKDSWFLSKSSSDWDQYPYG